MHSITLPCTLSSALPIALDGTLPACLTVRSQVSSQDTPKYTSESLSSTLPSMLSSTLPIAPDGTLTAYFALRSQIHSQEGRHSQSLLTICSHVCSCVLGPETCRVAGTRHQALGGVRLVAYGGQYLAGGGRRVACGVRLVAGGVCWPKS